MSDSDRLAEIKARWPRPAGLDREMAPRAVVDIYWLVDRIEQLRETHSQLREYAGNLEAERGRLRVTIEGLETQLAAMRISYDVEHHGLGVQGSDFARYGGSYHDQDGNPL